LAPPYLVERKCRKNMGLFGSTFSKVEKVEKRWKKGGNY